MTFTARLTATAQAFRATAARETGLATEARQVGDLDTAHQLVLKAARHRRTANRLLEGGR